MTSCQNTTIKQSINRFALPLVGLSLAKISCKFSREKILQIPHYDNLLINSLLLLTSAKITENLIICVHPSDFEKINWDEACGYISYHCKCYCKENSNKEKVIQKVEQTTFDSNNDIETREKKIVSLLKNNPLSCMEIAETMGLSAAATRRIVGRMAEDGLLTIEGTADR